jgi:hypothetical protein
MHFIVHPIGFQQEVVLKSTSGPFGHYSYYILQLLSDNYRYIGSGTGIALSE